MKLHPSIENLAPYKAGRSIEEIQNDFGLKEVIKLASNENPFGPSPKVLNALQATIQNLSRYPDASYRSLVDKLAKHCLVAPNQIVLGNGSNELIDLLCRIFANPGDSFVMAQTGFTAYAVCGQAARLNALKARESENLNLDLSHFEELCLKPNVRLAFLANPNNPTGEYIQRQNLVRLVENTANKEDFLLVIDEAYIEFVRSEKLASVADLTAKYKHLIVLRTFSKAYGLAGLRLGFGIASAEVTQWIQRVRNPFNINQFAVSAGLAALEDQAFIEKSRQLNWLGLDFWIQSLQELGILHYPTEGNFILCDLKKDSLVIEKKLLAQGVILRPVSNYGLLTHMRISVGLDRENKIALQALSKALN